MSFDVLFPIVVLSLFLLLMVRHIAYLVLKRHSANWSSTTATIQKCEAKFRGPFLSLSAGRIPKSLFGYSYDVAGTRYVGFFATARGLALAEAADMQEMLNGKTIMIRYDPRAPQRSFVVDHEIQGKAVHQSPDWIPRSLRVSTLRES